MLYLKYFKVNNIPLFPMSFHGGRGTYVYFILVKLVKIEIINNYSISLLIFKNLRAQAPIQSP